MKVAHQYEAEEHHQEEYAEQEEQDQVDAGQVTAPYLNAVNQQILQRLKYQQAQRIEQKRLEQERYASQQQQQMQQSYQPIQNDLVPASGQFSRSAGGQYQNENINLSSGQKAQQYQQQQQQESQHQYIEENDEQQQQEELIDHSHQRNSQQTGLKADSCLPEKEHLLVMTIDLGEGNCDILQVYEHDNPLDVAEQFCLRNGLSKEAMEILAKNIEANKNIVLTERQHQQYHAQLRRQTEQSQSQVGLMNSSNTQADNYYSNNNQLLRQNNKGQVIRNDYYKTNEQLQQQQQQQFQQQGQVQEQQTDLVNDENEQDQYNYQSNKNSRNPSQQQQQQSFQGNNTTAENHQNSTTKSKETCFDRLYNDALKKEIRQKRLEQEASQMSNSVTPSKPIKKIIGNTVVNLGEYLYQKGQIMMNHKKQNAEEVIMLREEQERAHTFHPDINHTSEQICQGRRAINGESTEQHLLKQGQLYKEKKDQLKCARENEQYEDCTFKPQIGALSSYLVELKRNKDHEQDVSGFDRLHEEARLRLQRQEDRQQENECTFQPMVNRSPKLDNTLPFIDRMMKSVNEKEKKVQDMKIKQQQQIQEQSEQTFHPQIGRAPRERNTQGLPVHEYLFKMGEERKIKSEIQNRQENDRQAKMQVSSLESSNQIIDKVRKERLFEMFCQLDGDGDGLISSQHIDISIVDKYVIQVLAPLLCEMEQQNCVLNFDTFYESSLRLISSLSISERDEFFHSFKGRWEEKKSKYNHFDHKPQLNSRSLKIARQKDHMKTKDPYQEGMEKEKEKTIRAAELKQQMIQRELSECTFKPQLFKPMKIYNFTDPKIQHNDNFFGGHQAAFELCENSNYKTDNNGYNSNGIVYNTVTINSIQQ